VKADKLRQVANKYVRDLNEPFMDSNLQVSRVFVCYLYVLWCFCCIHLVLSFALVHNWTNAVFDTQCELPTEF